MKQKAKFNANFAGPAMAGTLTMTVTHKDDQHLLCYGRSTAYVLLYYILKFHPYWSKYKEMAALFLVFLSPSYEMVHNFCISRVASFSRLRFFLKMDGWVRVLRPFNSISVISRRWKSDHERLCAMKRRSGSGRISPPVGFELATPWSEVGGANQSATRTLLFF